MSAPADSFLERFEALALSAADFGHADHVRAAFAMLERYDFTTACARYAGVIKAMAARAGASDKFNATITFAFMSVIAERKAHAPDLDFETFIARNPDLLSKELLLRWYAKDRLTSPLARAQFVLPLTTEAAG